MKTENQNGGIASWPKSERPRERLLNRGAEALTDAELIAILIRVGFKGTNALELARQLIQQFGSLNQMCRAPLSSLMEIKGLKGAKVAQLAAAMEIARRVGLPEDLEKVTIKSSAQAQEYFRVRFTGLSDEHFRILYINRAGKLIEDKLIARGSVGSVHPSIRVIVSNALQFNASGLIAGHNHPSGIATPSESDKILTGDLISTCRPLGIEVVDHVIVAAQTAFSFADDGLLDELNLAANTPNSF